MNVGVIGLGYVGLTLSIAAADVGIKVYGIETNNEIKNCLKNNRAHFYEPGLDSMIEKNNNKSFFVVDTFPKRTSFDAFIITVGTPLKKGDTTPNFDYIKQALLSIKEIYSGKELIILRSTVSVGTTRNIVIPFLAELCGKTQEEVLVAFCPERTVEGKAIEELTHLPQIISGNNGRSIQIAQDLFREITPYVIKVKSLEEAELVKLFNNTYRDMVFALGNVFCMTAQTFGIDGIDVIQSANQGYSRSNICLPGFVGGPCLGKDAYILTNNMPSCKSKDFILNGRKYNKSLEDLVVQWVDERMKNKRTKIVAVSGLAFKGTPDTSDLRDSSSVNIARKLKDKGYALNLHDYIADQKEMDLLGIGKVYDDIYESCQSADLLLILNNNIRYRNLEARSCLYKEKSGISILDSWKCCKNLYQNDKIDIFNFGNMFIENAKIKKR